MAGNSNQEMDADLAAMLGTGSDNSALPDFNDLFGEKGAASPLTEDINLSSTGFPQITKRLEEKGHDFFNDPAYYKNALSNEGDIAQRVHTILQKYLTVKDPKDRSVFRQQFITPYWEFLLNVARKSAGNIAPCKKFLLRFGLLHPSFLKTETREFFSKIVVENVFDQPILYVDEWLNGVGTSKMRPSTTDEVKIAKGNNQSKLTQLLEKAQGKLDGARTIVKQKDRERDEIEKIFRDRVGMLYERSPLRELTDVSDCLQERQKAAIAEIQNLLKELLKNDHDLEVSIKDFIMRKRMFNLYGIKLKLKAALPLSILAQ